VRTFFIDTEEENSYISSRDSPLNFSSHTHKNMQKMISDLGQNLVIIGTRIPHAVICLISALAFHEISTQIPHEVNVALEKGMEVAREKMLDNPNLSEDQIDAQMEIAKKFSGPGMIVAIGLLWTLFLGFVISLLGSAIMQKKENEY
jgi:hypothetical protein